jgi:hypothetical protein
VRINVCIYDCVCMFFVRVVYVFVYVCVCVCVCGRAWAVCKYCFYFYVCFVCARVCKVKLNRSEVS